MNNLKPLVWHEQEGWFSTKSPLTEYRIVSIGNRYKVYYAKRSDKYTREATGFSTIEEAKEWAWNHYNEKMQPYVKSARTWIYASDQLPVSDSSYLCAIVDKGFINYRIMMFWKVIDKFAFDHEKVLAWMPLPEPPISKESDCD